MIRIAWGQPSRRDTDVHSTDRLPDRFRERNIKAAYSSVKQGKILSKQLIYLSDYGGRLAQVLRLTQVNRYQAGHAPFRHGDAE